MEAFDFKVRASCNRQNGRRARLQITEIIVSRLKRYLFKRAFCLQFPSFIRNVMGGKGYFPCSCVYNQIEQSVVNNGSNNDYAKT